jgi:hypothetical protein
VEKVYSEGSGSLGGKLALARLISAKPHYFDFAIDPHGRVLALLQKYVPGVVSGGFGMVAGSCRGVSVPGVRYFFLMSECFRLFVVVLERNGLRV